MTEDKIQQKNTIRRRILAQRDAINPSQRCFKSLEIKNKIIEFPLFINAMILFVYCSYHSEVDTSQIMHHIGAIGKVLCVPRTLPARRQLQAIAIANPRADLVPGYKGIPEPKSERGNERLVSPQTIDIAIIPGAVFDLCGHRLGYGGGYYDRFLSLHAPKAYRVGIAFSEQLVDRLPSEDHDVPMDMLFTENDVYSWPRSHT